MKILLMMIMIAGVLTAPSTFAETTRGYMMSLESVILYGGLTERDNGVQLPVGRYFDDEQIEIMNACQKQRHTHAIQVESEGNYPSTEVKGVQCVEAPGFYSYWKKIFGF